jgi:FtsP/CotA-like multicopper oxidase with cupredoxin domain
MKLKKSARISKPGVLVFLLLLAAGSAWAQMGHMIDGITGMDGPVPGERWFELTAKTGYIVTPEGGSVFVWGFANGDGTVQYPGPTLIVNQGEVVKVSLTNNLPVEVSIVFPGQSAVAEEAAAPTQAGPLTLEAKPFEININTVYPGGSVLYTFTAHQPGTYLYHSGTRPDVQVDMGLFGALIVRPAGFDHMAPNAYGIAASAYDTEYLFLESEVDPKIHYEVQRGNYDTDTSGFFPTYWFLNGRAAPDTMYPAFVSWLPTQPYDCMPMMKPGQRLLMRVISAGRDIHPFHQHGNHAQVIARDGRLLDLDPLTPVVDLAYEVFTFQSVPGQTTDGIFTWTGEKIGWDVYGHAPGDPYAPGEYGYPDGLPDDDHGKPFPVLLPELQDLTFGGWWSGSPFLGSMGALPPGEGGMNPLNGFVYMWHSHTEKEMVNNDIFPGGMMTMLIIEPPMAEGMLMNSAQGSIQLQGGR